MFSHDILYFFQQLLEAPSNEEAHVLLEKGEEYDLRFELGFSKPAASFTKQNIQELVKGVCMHKIIYSKTAALDQLLEGLNSHSLTKLIESNTRLSMALFTCQQQHDALNAMKLRKRLQPEPSPKGSIRRAKEEEIVLHWYRFLDDVNRGGVTIGK